MKCTNCGTNIKEGEAFCGSCGAKLDNQIKKENLTNTINEKNGINKNAIISIVCSVICLFIFWWLSIAGIGLGVQALKQIKETKEKGKILAYIGIVLGIIAILMFIAGTILGISRISR